MSSITGEINPEILSLFEKHFKKQYEPGCLNEISDKINKFKSILKKLVTKLTQPEQKKELDMVALVIGLDMILPHPIGSEKLYKLNGYIKQANEIIKQRETAQKR